MDRERDVPKTSRNILDGINTLLVQQGEKPLASLGSVIKNARQRAREIQEGNNREIEQMKEMGGYWKSAREATEMDAFDAAYALGVRWGELTGIELGSGTRELWEGPFPISYSEVLNNPGLYPDFCERFGIPPYQAPES